MQIFKLFGSIFVDSEQADKSMDKTDKKAESLGHKFVKGAGAVGKFGLAVGASAAAAGASMVALAIKTADTLSTIDDASQRAGVSAEAFQKWTHAAKMSGIEVGTLEKAMVKQQKAFADAKTGSKSMGEAYQKLGIDISKVGSSSDAFDLVIDKLANMKDETQRNALANDIFGKSYADLAPLLNEGADGIAKLKQEAVDLGMVVSNEGVAAGAKFGDQWDKLKGSFGAIGVQLGSKLIPVLSKLMDVIIKNMPAIQKTMSDVFNVVGDVVTKAVDIFIKHLLPIIKDVYTYIVANMPQIKAFVKDAFGVIVELSKSIVNVFVTYLLPILANMFAWVKDNMPQIKAVFKGAFDVIVTVVKTVWEVFDKYLLPILKTIYQWVSDNMPLIKAVFKTVFDVIGGALKIVYDNFKLLFTILKTVYDFVDGVFSVIGELIKAAFAGVVEFMEPILKIFNDVVEAIVESIDKFKEFMGLTDKGELRKREDTSNDRGVKTLRPATTGVGAQMLKSGLVPSGANNVPVPQRQTQMPSGVNITVNNPTLLNRQNVTELSDLIVGNLRLAGVR